MREGWEMKRLGEVFSLEYGKPLDKGKRKFNGCFPVYGANGVIDRTDEYLIEFKSIIVGRKGSAGEINYTEKKFWPLDVTYYVKFDKKEYDLDFLFYLLSKLELTKLAKGVKPGINRNDVYNISVVIPPLSEQQHIVSILDKTFAAIDEAMANTEKNLNNAKELFQSQLNKIFSEKGEGWVEKKLGECFRLKSGDLMTTKMMNNAGIFPVYGGNGIAGYHDEYNLSGSNIIVGRVGALCGNVRHVTEKVWLTDNAFQLTDFRYQFDHSFLAYLLNFKNLRSLARQAAQPVISNSSLKDILLQFPQSIQEQQKIVSQLNALSTETKKLEAHYQKKSEQLEDLKKSILEKAFKGELSERKVKEMVEG